MYSRRNSFYRNRLRNRGYKSLRRRYGGVKHGRSNDYDDDLRRAIKQSKMEHYGSNYIDSDDDEMEVEEEEDYVRPPMPSTYNTLYSNVDADYDRRWEEQQQAALARAKGKIDTERSREEMFRRTREMMTAREKQLRPVITKMKQKFSHDRHLATTPAVHKRLFDELEHDLEEFIETGTSISKDEIDLNIIQHMLVEYGLSRNVPLNELYRPVTSGHNAASAW